MTKQYYCDDCGVPVAGKFFCCYQCDEYFNRIVLSHEGMTKEERAVAEKEEEHARLAALGAIRGARRAAEIALEMAELHEWEAQQDWHADPAYGNELSLRYDGLVVHNMLGLSEGALW